MDNDKRLERVEDKIDLIVDKLNSIDKTLSAQHVTLVEHTRRSTLLEEKMVPVERHIAMVQGALKLLGLLALGIGAAAGLLQILK